MAKRKRWFFTQLSEVNGLSPAKARRMLEKMEMPPEAFENAPSLGPVGPGLGRRKPDFFPTI